RDQYGLSEYLDYVDYFSGIFVGMFVFAMSIVLWNTGLLGGLRRYQEFGIRLALGESKGHIYRTLIYEAILIGIIGSVVGTVIGLSGVYYLQVVGLDIGDMLKETTMMMPSVLRAKMTPNLFYIGFIPGLFAMVLGNMLSGIGIYKRSTASLFKELEV
ncbi:MAG: ABC transporter permease, partial [Cyclobacteriaceae bacterium]|nr:ABC transporter permease [Cyclobacteriaceae bacterium]